jgi:hypothetical protein
MFTQEFRNKMQLVRSARNVDTCDHGTKQVSYDMRVLAKEIVFDLYQAKKSVYAKHESWRIDNLIAEFSDIANPCYTCYTEY